MALLRIWRLISARKRLPGASGRDSLTGTVFSFASALRKVAGTNARDAHVRVRSCVTTNASFQVWPLSARTLLWSTAVTAILSEP